MTSLRGAPGARFMPTLTQYACRRRVAHVDLIAILRAARPCSLWRTELAAATAKNASHTRRNSIGEVQPGGNVGCRQVYPAIQEPRPAACIGDNT